MEEVITENQKAGVTTDFNIRSLSRFSSLAKVIARDLNNDRNSPTFTVYKKSDIAKYLSNPYTYEKQLREAVTYVYGASSHFKRLIQYFVGLSDLSYIVEPYKIDPRKANVKTISNNYRKVLNLLTSMSVKTQFPKVLNTSLKEDVFYGTFWVTTDTVTIQQLPSEYCAISSIEDNVFNVSFDFSYFSSRQDMLEYYPPEFKTKYNTYLKDRRARWIELDAPNSFAVKCNSEIVTHAIPPFAGLLREIFEIEDYKNLKNTKTALENYAMLVMNLPLTKDGDWGIDLVKAKDFFENMEDVVPEEIGAVLSPMEVSKISFDKSNTGDTDTVANAEQSMFTAAGVSSLLFNNEKASANALLLSVKADQAITYGIVKSIEDVVNRLIHSFGYGKNFKVNFLDVSPYNRKEAGDAYLKAASYGLPMISMYAASQGLGQAELDNMSFLEGQVLQLHSLFIPIQNSNTMSANSNTKTDSDPDSSQPGAPPKEIGELTDSGEQTAEDGDDWG